MSAIQPNHNFYNEVDNSARRCPLCGSQHEVTADTIELPRSHFSTRWRFQMYCPEQKKKLERISLFERTVSEMFFERKDVINE